LRRWWGEKMKRLCVLLVVLLGLGACGEVVGTEATSAAEIIVAETTESITTEPNWITMVHGTLPAKVEQDYASVIEAYSNLIRNKMNGKYDTGDEYVAWDEDLDAFCKQFIITEDVGDVGKSCYNAVLWADWFRPGYAVYDINKDGTPELIVFSEDKPSNYFIEGKRISICDYPIHAIFTLNKGKPIMLGAYYERYSCTLGMDGTLYVFPSYGCSPYEEYAYVLPPGGTKLEMIEKRVSFGGAEGNEFYHEKNGIRTDFASGDEYFAQEQFPRGHIPDDPIMQLGLTFVPITP